MNPFLLNKFYSKKSFLAVFGGELRIFDENQNALLFFVKQKAFKLKEDISIFSDESKTNELLKIRTESIIDFSGTYEVIDASTKEKVGSLRRKGFKSILKDEWEVLDANGQTIALLAEDSLFKALLRRILTNLVPQTFYITASGNTLGIFKQTFNPFLPQFRVDFSMDTGNVLDRRLGIAALTLLQIIEGKQS
ncbi:hypothetical protein [Leptospira ryugenii]|uniref:hypothetical protein n=1 Tax=Leptospira ryugenii TaxID=1917863 RepID=UPI000D58FD14|nr:hypothetical protein [Leptospira ryugenii]